MLSEQMDCAQVQLISQRILDGVEPSYQDRKLASRHRDECEKCMRFHSLLVQAIAISLDIPAEDLLDHYKAPKISYPFDLDPRKAEKGIWQGILSLLSLSLSLDKNGSVLKASNKSDFDAPEFKRARFSKERKDSLRTNSMLGKYRFKQEKPDENLSARAQSLRALVEAAKDKIQEPESFAVSKAVDSPSEVHPLDGSSLKPEPLQAIIVEQGESPPLIEVPNDRLSGNTILDRMNRAIDREDELDETPWVEYSPATQKIELPTQCPGAASSIDDKTLNEALIDNAGLLSTTDAEGWTTSVMQQLVDEAAAANSAKLFELTEKDVDEIFLRMIIGKERTRKKHAKKLPDSEKTSQFGKISVAKLDIQHSHKGKITDIGKFLLDPDAVYAFEQILQSNSEKGNLKRLTVEQSKLVDTLHARMAEQPGVEGSIVMAQNGMVISSNLPEGMSADEIAAWSLCAQVNCTIASQLMNANLIYDLVLSGGGKDLIVSDFGGFFLITLSNSHSLAQIDLLLEKFDRMRG